MKLFNENSQVSWRKILTSICGLAFFIAVIGWLISNKFDELPKSYLTIIGSVFTFYFLKDTIRNLKIVSKSEKTGKDG